VVVPGWFAVVGMPLRSDDEVVEVEEVEEEEEEEDVEELEAESFVDGSKLEGGGSIESYTTRFFTVEVERSRLASCSIIDATKRSRATWRISGCSGTHLMCCGGG